DENFRPVVEGERNRRGVSFLRFFTRSIGTNAFPELLAGLRIERQQERIDWAIRASTAMHRRVALEDLHVKAAVVIRRAAAERPLKRELAVVFLNIAGPNLLAVEVERRQLAVSIKEPDQLAVGDRRRGSEVAFLVEADADAGLVLPKRLAGGAIQTQRLECARLLVH